MNDRGTSGCGPLHLAEDEKIVTDHLIEANDVMAEVGQMLGYRAANVAPVAGDQDPHDSMLSRIAAICLRHRARGYAEGRTSREA